jgi:hypothetical protein
VYAGRRRGINMNMQVDGMPYCAWPTIGAVSLSHRAMIFVLKRHWPSTCTRVSL